MSMFNNLKSDGLEESQDRLGGFSPLDTDVYAGKIKLAYAGESEKGALFVALVADFGGREYRETIYVSNKQKEPHYMQDNKKIPLPGFTIIDDLCLVASGKPLSEQTTEEKTVKLYDFEQKKEMPKAVQVLTDLVGQPIKVGILRKLENKTEKSGNEYVPTAETREVNNIDKVFHHEMDLTVAEARSGQEEAKFLASWTERNKGQTRDVRKIKDGAAGQAGAPKPSSGGNAAAPRTSLFGKKN